MEFLREQARKRVHVIDDELYFAIDGKNNTIDLTDKGKRRTTRKVQGIERDYFILPDLGLEISHLENDTSLNEPPDL